MITEKNKIKGKFDFLKIELDHIVQKEKVFYIGKIKVQDILILYTVEPAEYDIDKQIQYAEKFADESEYYLYLRDEDKKIIDKKSFQRKEDFTRVSSIKKFLNQEEFPLFPNTIIATTDLLNNYIDFTTKTKISDLSDENIEEYRNLSFLEFNNGKFYLYVPYRKSSILIIDGQHRIRGLEEAYNSSPLTFCNYELLFSFILNFDKSVIAKLFYTINYNQKSVNKSLLYHLSGEFSRDIDQITFLHEVVRVLNESEKSPFQKRIKMLGSIPDGISLQDKTKLTLSQAFLIDYLKPTISKDANKSFYPSIFLYYYQRPEMHIEILRFIFVYFGAIKNICKNLWDDPTNNILTKTISIGALIKLMQLLFPIIFINEFEFDPEKVKFFDIERMKFYLKGIENIDFSNDGEFGKVSSSGNLTKLKIKIIENLPIFEFTNFEEFRAAHKSKYQQRFSQWLMKKC